MPGLIRTKARSGSMVKRGKTVPDTATTPKRSQVVAQASKFVVEHWEFYQHGSQVKARMETLHENREAAVKEVIKLVKRPYSIVKPASYFVEKYSEVDLERLGLMKTKNGEPLSITHLVSLASLGDEKDRRMWMDDLEKEGWSPSEFKRRLQGRTNKPQEARGAGRKMKPATNLGQGLEQILESTRDWLGRCAKVWAKQAEPAWLAESGQPDERTDRLLKEAISELIRLRRAADGLEERLSNLAAQKQSANREADSTGVVKSRKVPTKGRSSPT